VIVPAGDTVAVALEALFNQSIFSLQQSLQSGRSLQTVSGCVEAAVTVAGTPESIAELTETILPSIPEAIGQASLPLADAVQEACPGAVAMTLNVVARAEIEIACLPADTACRSSAETTFSSAGLLSTYYPPTPPPVPPSLPSDEASLSSAKPQFQCMQDTGCLLAVFIGGLIPAICCIGVVVAIGFKERKKRRTQVHTMEVAAGKQEELKSEAELRSRVAVKGVDDGVRSTVGGMEAAPGDVDMPQSTQSTTVEAYVQPYEPLLSPRIKVEHMDQTVLKSLMMDT